LYRIKGSERIAGQVIAEHSRDSFRDGVEHNEIAPGRLSVTERIRWPISRCKGANLDTWEFVEEAEGTYEAALRRAGELQGPHDAQWQYRIWDCREKSPPVR